jgi:hypothetical protein
MITVHFDEGEMATVTVSERASGLYLEPTATTGAAAAAPVAPSGGRERKP